MVPEASLLLALLGALSADAAASPTPSPRREAVVLRTVESMYSAPSFETDVVSLALLGQLVAVHQTKGEFANKGARRPR